MKIPKSTTKKETPKRLTLTLEAAKRLFSLSGNRCAFPGCEHSIFNKDGVLIAEVCHIEGAKPNGERFNANMTNEERRDISNLILLCHEHHKVTNDVDRYTVKIMHEMKDKHERIYLQAAGKLVAQGFSDLTSEQHLNIPGNMELYRSTLKISHKDMEYQKEYFLDFAKRLAQVLKEDRQLLCIIGERSKDGRLSHDELCRITGSEEQKVKNSVLMLQKYGLVFIDIESPESSYLGEDIRLVENERRDFHVVSALMKLKFPANIDWKAIVINLRFDLLDAP